MDFQLPVEFTTVDFVAALLDVPQKTPFAPATGWGLEPHLGLAQVFLYWYILLGILLGTP